MKTNNILFIDDDPSVIKSYKHIFSYQEEVKSSDKAKDLFGSGETEASKMGEDKMSYDVLTASQGEEGVELVRKHKESKDPIKVAFIDMRMPPGIDGKETAKRIREIDQDIEIVIVTAYSDHDLSKIVSDIGAPDKLLYLKKPFDPVEIEQFALNLTTKWDEGRTKDEFIQNISHELKTPMASIIGFAQLLLDDKDEFSPAHVEQIEIINESGRLMRTLIDDLITMVKIGSGNLSYEPSRFDIVEVAKLVIKMFEPQISQKSKLVLSQHLPEKLEMYGDKEKVKQCLMNLVSNAIKYTLEGEIDVQIFEKDGFVNFAVKDTGIGIPEENIASICERFERVEKNHHNIPGLGLGLSICKVISQMHGGDVHLESKLDVGSTFTITFKQETGE